MLLLLLVSLASPPHCLRYEHGAQRLVVCQFHRTHIRKESK